jgi:hypothetical protein
MAQNKTEIDFGAISFSTMGQVLTMKITSNMDKKNGEALESFMGI